MIMQLYVCFTSKGWLERTPGLGKSEFHFWGKYRKAVNSWIEDGWLKPAEVGSFSTLQCIVPTHRPLLIQLLEKREQ